MKLEIINEGEPWKETMVYLEANYQRDTPKVPLHKCRIYQRGEYIVIEYLDKVYYYEHTGNYCYIEDAIHLMNPEVPAVWKTMDKLITFRQAIRENNAQGMGLEDLLTENISFHTYREFIQTARVFDKRHHGSVTF